MSGGIKNETSDDEETLASLQKIWCKDIQKLTIKSGKKTRFPCSSCDQVFRTKLEMLTHLFENHNTGFKCRLCSKLFSNSVTLVSHLTVKHSGKGFPCQKCMFYTQKASLFKAHVQNCERKTSVKWKNDVNEKLIKEVASKENQVNPKTSVKKEKASQQKKSYTCNICVKSFSLKNRLLSHRNKEHGLDISCDTCGLVFSSMASLRSHKFTKHTGKDKICEICGYSTKKTYDFKRHQVKHSSVYTIKCTVCNKGFYSQYEFSEHVNMHTAQRPYQCEVCGVDYSRRSSLILHRIRKHPEIYESSKRCQICNKVCLTKETMAAHIKTHVEGRKRYYCDICGKGLLTRVILKVHRRSHTGEKPFDCSYCSRGFSCKKNLSVHIRLHTGDRPYSCKFCWKAYTKSSALKAHEKSHSNHHQIIPM